MIIKETHSYIGTNCRQCATILFFVAEEFACKGDETPPKTVSYPAKQMKFNPHLSTYVSFGQLVSDLSGQLLV